MQYCSLQLWTLLLSPVTYTTGHCFFFGPVSSFFSGVISPFFFKSILCTYRPGEFIFQCHTFLLFHTVHEVLKARILKWIAFPFSSGPRFVRNIRDSFILAGNYKTFAPWKKSYDQRRQDIKKQKHCFINKGPSSQSYGFSSSHV